MNILQRIIIVFLANITCFSAKNLPRPPTEKTFDFNKLLDDYDRNKTNLLRQESMYFLGGNLHLSHEEGLVNNILMKLKNEEFNQSFYNPERFNFSKHYFSYKDYIEQSKVYQIIKRMPKGAALHLHSTYVLDGDYLLNMTYEDHLYACYDGNDLKLRFSDTVPQRPCSVAWTLVSELRNAADNVTQFDNNLKKYFSLQSSDDNDMALDLNSIWHKFEKLHSNVKALIVYRPMREKFIYDTLQKFYDDNVMYIELRTGMHILHELDGTEHDEMYTIKVYKDVTKKFIEEHPDFIGMKLILSKYRKTSEDSVRKSIEAALKMKKQAPQIIAGYDLVGQEDAGKPLSEFLPVLLEYKDKIDYYLHAGETNWFGTTSDDNLVDAILLGTKRIGHGYALNKHPVLMSLVKKQDIAVEVNVISNAVLALVKDVRNHPLATFLSLGLPVVLSSDDPGVWGAEPLSHDFYVSFIAVASKQADLRLLKQLAINSIRYSALDNKKKTKLLKVFGRRWNVFIKEVIADNSCDKTKDTVSEDFANSSDESSEGG